MLPSGVASVHSAQRVSCSEKLKFTFELPYEAQGHTKTMKRGKLLKTTFIRSTLGRWSNIIFVFFFLSFTGIWPTKFSWKIWVLSCWENIDFCFQSMPLALTEKFIYAIYLFPTWKLHVYIGSEIIHFSFLLSIMAAFLSPWTKTSIVATVLPGLRFQSPYSILLLFFNLFHYSSQPHIILQPLQW